MTHNTPAPVADKALAERLATVLDFVDTVMRMTDPESEDSYFCDHPRECAEAIAFDERRPSVKSAIEHIRSGQLITLAEADAMVAAALRVHAGRCEEGESITEKYLRRYPRSKKTRSWAGAMVHMRTMNGIWKPDGHGYTINFAEAWVLPLEQARKTVSGIYEDHGGTYYRASAAAIRAAATGTKEGE